MPRDDFEARRAARISRLMNRATTAREKAARSHETSVAMSRIIPFGQPILIGHHSERRDRRYRDRIWQHMTRAAEQTKKAEHYSDVATAAARNTAISSDDPEAVRKLREKIANAERDQVFMKATNKAVRKNATPQSVADALHALGYPVSLEWAAAMLTPDFTGRIAYPSYKLTNNNANIRRMQARLVELAREAARQPSEPLVFGDIRVEESDNRVQLRFPAKPAKRARERLRCAGFLWAPSTESWQRLANDGARYAARQLAQELANSWSSDS